MCVFVFVYFLPQRNCKFCKYDLFLSFKYFCCCRCCCIETHSNYYFHWKRHLFLLVCAKYFCMYVCVANKYVCVFIFVNENKIHTHSQTYKYKWTGSYIFKCAKKQQAENWNSDLFIFTCSGKKNRKYRINTVNICIRV